MVSSYLAELSNRIANPKKLVLHNCGVSKLSRAYPVLVQIVKPTLVLYRITLWVGSKLLLGLPEPS